MLLDAIIISLTRLLSATVLTGRLPHGPGEGVVVGPGDGDQKPFPLPPDNNGIHLAVGPQCGQLFGNTADINAGIDGGMIKTVVSFGVSDRGFRLVGAPAVLNAKPQDSYTDGGKSDGSPLDPPILVPPSPLAGGRSTNGLTWVEHVANDVKATIMDYAVSAIFLLLLSSIIDTNPVNSNQERV